jgi:hypothetical protein
MPDVEESGTHPETRSYTATRRRNLSPSGAPSITALPPPYQLIIRCAPPNGLNHQSELGSADCSQLEYRKGAHMKSPRASWWHSYKMTRGPSLFRSDRLGKHSKFLQPQHQPTLPFGRVTPGSCSAIMIKLVQRNGREAEIGSYRTYCRRCFGGHPKDLVELKRKPHDAPISGYPFDFD